MANNLFLDETIYAKVFLLLLKNQLVAARLVDGQFKNELTDENGLTVNIKRPPQFVAQDGEALKLQSVVAGSVPVLVDQYKNVHLDVGDLESVQSYNALMENESMLAATSELAQTIDGAILDETLEFASEVGTPGNTIGTPQQFNKVHTRLMNQSVPNASLNAIVSFEDGEEIRGALIGTNIDGVNRTALEKTRIPILSEINLFASNNLRSVVAGDRLEDTGPAIDGAAQNVDYRAVKDTNSQVLDIDGGGFDATYSRGDTFTVAGVFAVNNRSRQVLPFLKQFVILADAVADGAGLVTLTISPPMIVGGTSDGVGATPTLVNTAFQTISAIPADGAAIVFNTAPGAITPIRTAFHKRAISLVSAKLRTPFTGVATFVSDPDTGIGIRYWRGSDITTGRHIHRWDTIFGVQMVQPELGARVNGSS